jgi:hypothetical protein
MITIVYSVEPERAEDEMEWLRLQKVTASFEMDYDWVKDKPVVRFVMIVNPDAALAIKLRHNLDMQFQYKPR